MKVKMILPALTEAVSPFFRALKYSLFPPLGLATLAGYLDDDDEVKIVNEHVEAVRTDDEPDLVVMTVYVSAARRAYKLADTYRSRGAHVCMGGLHVTARPNEAAAHADTIFLGPGEASWPAFLADFRAGRAGSVYRSGHRTLEGMPPVRRDLFKRHQYLVPNTVVVSRGCPHKCDFCYNSGFYAGGRSFYTMTVEAALAEIDALPGRHLYFLDDHLFGDERFASALFDGMRGMGRLWQAAGTVRSVLRPRLLEKAARSGLRSLFVGFETIDTAALAGLNKRHNEAGTYQATIRRLHDNGVMVNGSFVFGLDSDDESVFDRTVDWAVAQGIETATFHVLTPYPGTRLHEQMASAGRIITRNWDLYDARHAVFRPARMSAERLEAGHRRAYGGFYQWGRVLRSACVEPGLADRIRHLMYVGGWRKLEPMWNVLIKLGLLGRMMPLLESLLAGFGRYPGKKARRRAVRPASLAPEPPWDAASWTRRNAGN